MLLLFFIALLLSFLLSGLETAVLSVSRVRVRHAADEKDKRAAQLLPLLDDRDGLLGALTIANHIANVGAFGFITWQLVNAFGAPGYIIGFVLALPLFIIGLEVLPKNLFRRYPFRALIRLLPIVRIAAKVRGLFRTMRTIPVLPPDEHEGHNSARQDIVRLLDDMANQKLIAPSASEMIQRVLSSRPVKVTSLMVPMEKVVTISADSAAEAARHLAREHGFSTIIVSDPNDEERCIGVINTVTLPTTVPPDRLVRQHTRPMDEVDAETTAIAVLQRMRRRGMTMVQITQASSHKPLGIVTEEDIIHYLLPAPDSLRSAE